jgi:predicted dehydrogenase
MNIQESNKTVVWGIIGCGNVTEVKSGPAFNKVNNSRLHAVMRRDANLAEDYATRHNVPVWYSDAKALINDPEINAIYIATPPKFHEEYAIAALEKGKFVYVEKPVTLNVNSCKSLVESVNKTQGKLVVAHYRRALPMFLKVKELVDDKVLGAVKSIRLVMHQPEENNVIASSSVNWRVIPELSGGGLFYDLAPHQLDIIQYIFGEAVSHVGTAANQSNIHAAEDAVCGIMKLNNDILFQGSWNFNMPAMLKEDSCQIIGEKGYIQFPFFGNQLRIVTDEGVDMIEFQHPQHIQQPMIQQVVDYFLGTAPNPCSIHEALKSMEVMESFVY